MLPTPTRLMAGALAALCLAPLTSAAPAFMGNGAQVTIQFLQSTGADGNAKCKVKTKVKDGETDLEVELENIDAGSYDLIVGGEDRGDINVDGSGEGELEFEPVGFDVFGETFVIRQGDTVFFDDVFDATGPGASGGNGNGGGKTKLEIFLVNVGPDGNAKGKARYEDKGNKTRFKVTVEQLDNDDDAFQLWVGDTQRAEFDTTGLHEVELDFRDPIGDDDDDDGSDDGEAELHFLLDFDPLGEQIEIRQGETVFLSGVLPGQGATKPPKKAGKGVKNLGKKKGDALLVPLLDLGVLAGANGKMKLEQSNDETEFEVEIEDVPADTYTLRVDGMVIGDFDVVDGQGEFDFSTDPDPDETLLDFEVKGKLVEVLLGDDPVLAAVFPTSVQAALGKFKKEKVKDNLLKLNLLNVGVDLDATGTARWKQTKKGKQTLQVRTRDLPAGTYKVLVDGTQRGELVVSKQDGPGLLHFSSTGNGSATLLDFDVLGQELEIADQDDTVLLAVTMGEAPPV